jgi:outer membrane beta-barrel protein
MLSSLALVGMLVGTAPAAAASPGIEAIRQFRSGASGHPDSIENRFFLKESRFELAPSFGYVPNNPFARRFVGGVVIAYHFTEEVAAEANITYSPDLGVGDLKGLTKTLVQIAQTGAGDGDFQQPLDKVTLAANFGARWAPIYGKINLVGETVLNFDFYGVGAIGFASKANHYACAPAGPNDDVCAGDPLAIVVDHFVGSEVEITPVIGIGIDVFLTQGIALKLDVRDMFWVDGIPDYDPTDGEPVQGSRLYQNLVTSAGVSFFFPKMKPRLYNF